MALKHLLMIGALACGLAACKLPHLPTRTAEAEVKGSPPCACAKDKPAVAKAPAAKVKSPATALTRQSRPAALAGPARARTVRTRTMRTTANRSYRARNDGGAETQHSGRYAVQSPYPVVDRGGGGYLEQRDTFESESFSERYAPDYGAPMSGPPGPPPARPSGAYVGGYGQGGYAPGRYGADRYSSGPPSGYTEDRYGPPPVPCHC